MDKGFTVVEVVVVTVLLMIITIPLVSFVQYIQHTQRDTYYMNQANEAARSKIAELQNTDFDSITNGTINFSSDSSLDNLPSGTTAQAVITTPSLDPESKQVDISIRYPVGTVNKYVTMTAFLVPSEGL